MNASISKALTTSCYGAGTPIYDLQPKVHKRSAYVRVDKMRQTQPVAGTGTQACFF